jgi:hypothetical protein
MPWSRRPRRPARGFSTARCTRRAPQRWCASSTGDTLITDGPYAEGKEHIGGFLIVKAPDLDAALAWGRKLAGVLADGPNSLPVEVRPFQADAEDR